MDFIFTRIVVETDLTDILDTESVQKTLPPFWYKVSMCNIECPFEVWRLNRVEEPVCLGDVMRDIVNFGVFWFPIMVLKEDDDLRLFRSVY